MINLKSKMTEHYNSNDWSRIFLSLSLIPHVETWLDCGAGDGTISAMIAQVVNQLTALDYDIEQIQSLIKLKNESIIHDFQCPGNVTSMPFVDNSFDGLSIFETLEHLTDEDLEKAIKEIKRVVKPNGYIILSVPQRDAIQDPDHKQEFSGTDIQNMFPGGEFYHKFLQRDDGRALLWYIYKTINIK